MKTDSRIEGISRRDVITGAVAVGGAVAGAGLLGACARSGPSSVPSTWDKEAEVVVVGYGGAGAAAAITAAEQGASVLVIEKAPHGGGNTGCSSGGMVCPSDAGKIAEFVKFQGFGSIDDETARVFAAAWVGVPEWFEKRGAQLNITTSPTRAGDFPGYDTLNKSVTIKRADQLIGVGRDLFEFLDSVVKKQKTVEVMLNTPAKRLIQDPATKEILGVIAESGGRQLNVKARKAVIMTPGGFSANREMLATYIEEAPIRLSPGGTPYNTGDGINMVIDVGADLWRMNGIEWARDGFQPDGFQASFWLDPKADAWISVNKAGRRFRDESVTYGHAKKHLEVFHYDLATRTWPNQPWFMVFDDKTRKAGPVIMVNRGPGRAPYATYNLARELHSWSPDNTQEIQKGWIRQAPTIADLAKAAGIDEAGLQQTVTKYNEYCRKRSDQEFGRRPAQLAPLDTPPFCILECVVSIINTQGGPRRNARSQAMGPFGNIIPRLYAGGEFGSLWGFLYPGGCNLPECVASGSIAASNAVAEKPWG